MTSNSKTRTADLERAQPWVDAVAEARPATILEHEPLTNAEQIAAVLAGLAASGVASADAGGSPATGDVLFGRDVAEGGRMGALSDVRVQTQTGALHFKIGDTQLAVAQPTLTFIRHAHGLLDSVFLLSATPLSDSALAWRSGILGGGALYVAIGCPLGRGLHEAHPSLAMRPSLMLPLYLRTRFAKADADAETESRRVMEAKARDTLKAEYARANPDRTTLTDAAVDDIAWRALQLGVQPTMELIRDVAGGGSPTHIHPLLKRFYAGLLDNHFIPAPPSDVPREAQEMWERVLEIARREASLQQRAEQTALEDARQAQNAAVAAREADLAAAQAELARQREQLAAAAEERNRALTRLESDLARAREHIESLTHVERGQAQDIARLTAERDTLREQALAATTHGTALATRLEQLQADRAALAETLAAERLSATRAAAAAAAETAEVTQRLAVVTADREHRKVAMEDLSTQLADTRQRLDERERQLRDLQHRLHAQADAQALAQRMVADSNARLAELGETAASQRAQLERANADLTAVTRERDRLDTLVRTLHGTPPRQSDPAGAKSKRT
ncbi:DNA-binding protein [Rhodanobacter sp. FW106-PBR-LB-2-11]|uniref:DNA-binding protein n=1 Tax=Rhodanobacter sp. FW106-PBR-LB-2-11 TaxID=1524463 RepID=UPI0034E4B959